MTKYLLFFIFLLKMKVIPSLSFTGSSPSEEDDYCNKDLFCKMASGPHIKCNNSGAFGSDCPDNVELVVLNDYIREEIVAKHNKYRNLIASGKLKGYESAERMGKMSWCSDLAEIAELNVLTCKFKHDDCRNTRRFPYSGQNLGTWQSNVEMETEGNLSLSYFLPMIHDWFMEYKNANMSLIKNFQTAKKPIGHFTVMVAAKNNCVGCSMIKFKKENSYRINIACNYAWTNIFNYSIYKSGEIASKCQTNMDEIYPALCSTKENYSQNPDED